MAGGADGLGAPLVRALSARRARVVIADVDVDRARELARELSATKGEAIAVPLDVVDGTSCAAAVDATVQQSGGLDGLVNASGIYRVAPALELTDADWSERSPST